MRCQKCGGHNFDRDYKCLICGHLMSPPATPIVALNDSPSPRRGSSTVDVVETSSPSPNESDGNPSLGLLICPQCGQRALFWNRHNQIYKCVDPKCGQKFTIDEYKNIEVTRSQEERQTEPTPSSVLTVEAQNEPEHAAPEQMLSSMLTTEAQVEPEHAAPEQMPSSMLTAEAQNEPEHATPEQISSCFPMAEAKDEIVCGATEQIPSIVPTAEAQVEPEYAAPEQISSSVPMAEVQDKIVCGITEQKPYSVPTAKSAMANGEIQHSTKSGKQLNRKLAFLLVGVLAIVIVILAVLLVLKPSNVDRLSSELDKSRQALAESQTQLAASLQDSAELRTQLTEAQQEIEALQAEIAGLKPQLTPSEPFVYSGEIVGGGTLSFPVELQKFERIEGRITGGLNGLAVQIQDAGGGIVKDLGRILQSNFTFTAQKSGVFTIVIREPSGLPSKYSLQYIIYQF